MTGKKDLKQVYFNEYNLMMGNSVYLPIVSGLLQAYSQTKDEINKNYEFMPFIFFRDDSDKIVSKYENPSVAAFSASMWNMNLCLDVARKVKEKYPKCLIVFGGPQVPFEANEFFKENSFVDVTVRGEGERTFADILIRFLESRDFRDIAGISYRDPKTGKCVKNDTERPLVKDLDIYPSPYLEGIFNDIMLMDINFQAIIETNRGCPFTCVYCFWGQGGLSSKCRFFSFDYVQKTVDWLGKNKIGYVFCADGNFGMFKRDVQIAECLVDAKKKYGYPEKFRTCYGKNAEDNIFKIGKLLTEHGLEKSVTLSKQSNDPTTLENIRRKNIKQTVYNELQNRYNKENIPTYTELILGLPGETYNSFKNGIEDVLQSGIKNQLYVYFLQVYPNTELADKNYQKKYGVKTLKIPLNEIHCSVHSDDDIIEYEDIVIATDSMSVEDWKKSSAISWTMQLFHGLKIGFYILSYLVDRYKIKYTDFFEYISLSKIKNKNVKLIKNEVKNFYDILDKTLQKNSPATTMHEFGNIYWGAEESCYLNISENIDVFFDEIFKVIKEFLEDQNIKYDEKEIWDVVLYQKARTPNYKPLETTKYHFDYNIPEYFENYFLKDRSELLKNPQTVMLKDVKDFDGDKQTFAREILVYGRKSDRMLNNVELFEGKNENIDNEQLTVKQNIR